MESVVQSLIYGQEIDYFEIDLDAIFNNKTSIESYFRLKKIVNYLINKSSLNTEEMKYYCLVNGVKDSEAENLLAVLEKETPNIIEVKNRNFLGNFDRLQNFEFSIRHQVCSKNREVIQEPKYSVLSFALQKDSQKNSQCEINLNCSKTVADRIYGELEKIDQYLKVLSTPVK
jgi:hypothetical protein